MNFPKAKKITGKNGIELLKAGHTLTQPGKDLNTLRYNKELNAFSWEGQYDQDATILGEKEVKELIWKNLWHTDLL